MFIAVCTIIGVIFLALAFRTEMKSGSGSHVPAKASESSQKMSPEAERLRDIADAHADFSAEVFMLNVHGRKAVAEVDYLSAGDALELYETSSDDICVRTLDGVKLGTPLIPIQSDFRRALAEHVEYEVYMGGRNNGFMDNGALITIIVFYKLDGVPPSHLTIE